MAKADTWTPAHVKSLAPDEASIPAAREVLRKGGFGTVEPTGDGRGWWVVCRGLTDTYQVSVRRAAGGEGEFDCECTCPSYKNPCKHALALLLYLVEHPEMRTEAEAPKTAASDFEGLLRAVFANPDDDTARLVFADFLEENDQSDRAAFIRYQCEQAREKPNSKRYKELKKLLEPLGGKFRAQIEPLPAGMGYEFRRGFLRLECAVLNLLDTGALPARIANLFRDGWVETLLTSYFYGSFGPALLAQVGELDVSRLPMHDEALVTLVAETADARATGRLTRVTVHKSNQKALDQFVKVQQGEAVALTALPRALGPHRAHYGLSPRVFDLLLRAGRLSGATELSLSGELGDAELSALLATADLSALRNLRLQGWELTRAGVEELANSPALARLEELELTASTLGPGSAAVLAAGTGLRRLGTLHLSNCELADADAEALADARSFPDLSRLDLRINQNLTARGAAAVLAARHLPHLKAADLGATAIPNPEQIPLLLDAPDRADLTVGFTEMSARRRVNGAEVIVEIDARLSDSTDFFDSLADCAGAKRVTQFSASQVNISASEIPALAAGLDPEKLWRLDLSDNPLRNDGAAALAAAFAHYKLLELNLSTCRIQSAGVLALVNGPLLAHVRVLDLSQNNIGKAGAAALLKGAVPPALKELVLKDCRLADAEKKQLKAKFGPRVKL